MKKKHPHSHQTNFFKGLKHEFLMLTPEKAKDLRDRNIQENRNLSKHPLNNMIRDIQAGHLYDFLQGVIIVDKNGNMLDGQYRCNAVIETGIPIPTSIITGLDPEIFHSLDLLGKPRSFSESLKASGFHNAPELKGTLKMIAAFREPFKPVAEQTSFPSFVDAERQKYSARFYREMALNEPEISDCVDVVCYQTADDDRKNRIKQIVPLHVISGMYYTFHHINADLADTMIEGFGSNFKKTNRPFAFLKDFLWELNVKSKTDIVLARNAKLVTFMQIYAFIMAWNAEMTGRKIRKNQLELKLENGEKIKDVFLEVIEVEGAEKYHKWLKENVPGF